MEKNQTQFDRIAKLREDKRKRALLDREANKSKRKKMKKVTMFGVLGLDSIIPEDTPDNVHKE
jgi:hypothetical protein